MISGSMARARARPTRFRMPPESSAGFLPRMLSGSPTSASRGERRSGESRRPTCRVLPQAESRRSRRSSCYRTGRPAGRGSRSGSAGGSAPARSMRPGPGRRNRPRPRLGCKRPMIVFNSTVLPQPLSPITATVCPRGIVQVDVAQHVLPAEIARSPSPIGSGRSCELAAIVCCVAVRIRS